MKIAHTFTHEGRTFDVAEPGPGLVAMSSLGEVPDMPVQFFHWWYRVDGGPWAESKINWQPLKTVDDVARLEAAIIAAAGRIR